MSQANNDDLDLDIAIIGMSGRFPGANNIDEFWQNLQKGVESISFFSDRELESSGINSALLRESNYVKAKGVLEDIDLFDASFFDISPREAKIMEPQQRLFLECAWEAVENAGYAPGTYEGSVGVYAGAGLNTYLLFNLSSSLNSELTRDSFQTFISNDKDFLATRVSYKLNLNGPSLTIQTACSTSLVAVHLACQSLLNGECDMALAGGVSILLPEKGGYLYQEGMILSPDGHCRAFDAEAQGTLKGDGLGIVVLKRLVDALADGDSIHAVIKGSAINNDGSLKVGYTAPSENGQAQVIKDALAMARVTPESMTYVEAHGTGTPLGDPIEIAALTQAFRASTEAKGFCAIGSLKTNIGHLDTAAGVAGLIKTVLALKHKLLPPSLHFKQPNPHIDFANSPFYVNTTLSEWTAGETPRRAGVSSFGIGGTNAHVVVEEAPAPQPVQVEVERPLHILCLSGKSQRALKELAVKYERYLAVHPSVSLGDVCYTANVGRTHFSHRLVVVAETLAQMHEKLATFANQEKPAGVLSGQVEGTSRPKVVFLFAGQGSQYVGMGRQLYEMQPTFRQALDRCDELLRPYLQQPLLSVLYPEAGVASPLNETAYTQPALFALEYALAELWRSWGIVPDAVMGHSLGEYVAACIAGVFSLEDALKLVAERSQLMQTLPQDGQMAAVFADEERVRAALAQYKTRVVIAQEQESAALVSDRTQVAIAKRDPVASIAGVNSPENTVISGAREAVESAIEQLKSEGITVQPLQVSHAFHSPLMEPILDEFERKAARVEFKAPSIPLISNLTGQMLKAGEIPDANYWRRHMRETVQFAAGMNTLAEQGYEVFLEVGPSSTLVGMGKRCLPKGMGSWLPSLKQGQDDWQVLLNSLGVLETHGVDVNWAGFDQDYQRCRVPLPTYPFERKRYWIEPEKPLGVHDSDTQLSKPNGTSLKGDQSDQTTNFQEFKPLISAQLSAVVAEPKVDTTPPIAQGSSSQSKLRTIVARLLQMNPDEIDVNAPFLEMGADSLVLVEAVHTIENTFGIKVAIRQFFEELATIDALATYIDKHITPEWALKVYPQPEVKPSASSQHSAVSTSVGATADVSGHGVPNKAERIAVAETALERIMAQQLEAMSQLMSQQLEVLRNNGLVTKKPLLTQTPSSEFLNQPIREANTPADASSPSTSGKSEPEQANAEPILPLRSLKPELNGRLNPDQQRHLEELIARYTKRTQKSKQRKQACHPVLADSRASAGFRPSIKEMLYPIIGQRAKGSRIWDLDGNEYVDITMGFGVQLFGHDAPFITEALEEQLKQGLHLGPQSHLAGEVAELIGEMTGVERVTFCNSGTEAVMTALRLARTATGRSKIAVFSGSYHGHFDGVLVTAQTVDGKLRSVPIAPGVTQHIVEDVLVLEYGNPQSLDVLQAHAHELAAVVVEPVQSRRPDLQPKGFLQQLRQLTATAGTALIFDEMITGFRLHPGGAQAWFDIEADLVTYGKVIGGGLPIGVVAGKATYMNGIDGGLWNYGDASSPHAETTFFAGTFNKHPLTMAAARAVLKHLKEHSPAIQQQLNQRTLQLAETLNTYFEAEDVPIHIVHFGSLFRFAFSGNLDLFFYHLLEKGVYIWEGRNCFLSTAHSEADINYVIQAVKDSVEELREGGFLPKRSPNSQNGDNRSNVTSATLTNPSWVAESNLTSVRHQMPGTSGEAASLEEVRTVPLTEAQKQLWVLAQVGDEAAMAYNVPLILELWGSFDWSALHTAVQRVVQRHEALRTIISSQGDFQDILPTLTINVPLLDFSSLDTNERETKVAQWLREESRQCFDLTQGPLLRIHILKLESQRHLLVLTVHHIVFDGWSMGVLLQELSAFYSAQCQGVVCQQEPPPQFKDYIQWQLQQSESGEMAKHKAYWLGQFADSIPILELPTDHTRPPVKTYRGARVSKKLEANFCAELKRLSRQKGCTLFMTLLAGYMVSLHRLTNQDDIVVGIPVANRTLEGSEKMVGYCAHLLAIRSFLVGFPAFSEYLTKIKHVLLDAYEHQDYPFAKLINQLNLGRDPSRSPLVTATFNLDRPLAAPKMFGLELKLVEPPISYAQFDINLNVIEINDELLLEVDYSTDLFEAETITRMLGHLQTLLKGMVANPAQRLVDLPLLAQPERHTLLVEWNDTQVDYPKDVCIHELFEAQVERTPDAVAVVFESEQLTYWELNNRANQLAHHLRALGVAPDVLVGICVERSLEMVVGLLGILKAGGAYVPLDPAYPQERLAFMLEDSQVPVLLTQQHLVEKLPENQARVVCLDSDWEAISPPGMASLTAQHNQENLVSSVTPENLVYVIYTSGSTGTPKGVQIQHTGLVNLVIWHQRTYSVTPADRATQLAGPAFDASVWELWPYLTAGASVHLSAPGRQLSPSKLLEWLSTEAITICFMPTPLAAAVLEQEWSTDLALRFLLTGGDKLQRAPQQAHTFTLVNHYGPTENTVVTTSAVVAAATGTDAPPPIGRPIANTQVYLLDAEMQPVPVGVTGELYIGGDGLARGYLNRPELTAEKFIPNPFSNTPGRRLYKTGDLARYLPDGNIQFLGRLDDQVKIRGFRIELGEIEALLCQHPAVQEVVVLAREDLPGNKRLVAYVVVNQVLARGMQELHDFLKQKLPEYMVPSAFVQLESLPLTANGKVDRRALLTSDTVRSELAGALVAPRTPVEQVLAAIWADILGLEQVGIHDNFFELGGHSLLATQVISQLRNAFQIELPLSALFGDPTVAGLAERIETVRRTEQGLQMPPLLSVDRDKPLPLSFAQARLWFLEQFEPDSFAYNIPAALRLTGTLHVAALSQSLNEIVRRHEALRTTFTTVNGEPAQVIAPALTLRLPLVDLRTLPEEQQAAEVERVATVEAKRPFDLSNGPLLHATLLQLSEAEYVLLLVMHHIASDGWSMGVLLRELATLYEAFSIGKPSPLADLPLQYADFAHWQRQWLQKEALAVLLGYWQQQLKGAPPVLELPTDRPRPPIQTFRGATQSLVLPKPLSQKLKALSQRSGVTLFMTLLATFAILLHWYTGQNDIVIGTDVANRNRAETEELIGFFINQLVLRTDLFGNPSFQDLLGQVREVTLGAYDHQDLPFDKLVDALKPERDLSRTPLFQVKFTLQNTPMPSLELPGLTVSLLEVENKTAKLDLLLNMMDTEQGLMGALEYNTELFDAASMSRMLGHFETLLSTIVAQPEAQLNVLTEMLDVADKQYQFAKEEALKETRLQKFKNIKRKSIGLMN